ncbi:GNAT family N-acetyltransferase [Candidatus Babeliales bacterium]|nr:GNAT family N-acetyltransferase [Candidatus Babeliales bacterium]
MKKIIAILLLGLFVQQTQGMSFIAATILTKLYEQPKPQRFRIPKECEGLISFTREIEKITQENITKEDEKAYNELFFEGNHLSSEIQESNNAVRINSCLTFGKNTTYKETAGVMIFRELPENRIFIKHLSISKKYQQKGFGTLLLEYVEALPQTSSISLYSLPEAHFFYKKNGFIPNKPFSVFMEKNVKQ